jgi:hypothetical protein
MVEIGATQAKWVFAFQEEEISLPQLLATPRALRVTQDGKNDEFFGLWRGPDVALSCHHASAVHLLQLLHISCNSGGRTHLCDDRQCGQLPGTLRGGVSFDVEPVSLAVFCPGLFPRVGLSLEASPNRATVPLPHDHFRKPGSLSVARGHLLRSPRRRPTWDFGLCHSSGAARAGEDNGFESNRAHRQKGLARRAARPRHRAGRAKPGLRRTTRQMAKRRRPSVTRMGKCNLNIRRRDHRHCTLVLQSHQRLREIKNLSSRTSVFS